VVVLLVGGIFVIRRRKKSSSNDEDDSFFEETDDSYYDGEEPEGDSFMLDQSSSIYAASQLDANADVDPVQEADVYLAYGRDEQAAEILRDALSSEPDRVALHAKLCEVYARQNDIIAFEEQAMRLHSLTKGVGFEWERIARLAQSISPNKIGVLGAGSDIPDTKPPASSAPTQMNVPPVLHDDADTQPMDFMGSESGLGFGDAPKNDAFSDLDVSLDFSKSVNPQFDGDSFSDSSSDAPSFSMDDDDEEEGPMTRLALAEEFLAIGNKNDAKEIVQEVLAENLSDDVKKRAQALLQQAN
jgi:FimV C-terminal domain